MRLLNDDTGGWYVKIKKVLLVILGIILISTALVLIFRWLPIGDIITNRQKLLQWLAQYGRWAPLITIILHILQVLAAPIPGTAIDAVNGVLFGPWLGTLYSMIGLLIGSMLLMWLARRFGRPLVERYVEPELIIRLDNMVEQYGLVFIFLVFLLPFLPDDALCLLAGLTTFPLAVLFLLALVGRAPGVFFANWLGSQAKSLSPLQWGIVAVLLLITVVLVWVNRNTLPAKVLSFVESISKRFSRTKDPDDQTNNP
jgi:uncharacterized membrane protein YdjX (TVP38/TMEM64 family)